MNASKTLIAAIAAATIVGTVGFVSAQTTTDPATPAAQGTEPTTNQSAMPQDTQPEPSAAQSTAPADMSSPPYVAPSTSDAPAPADDTATTAAEPQPKADRN